MYKPLFGNTFDLDGDGKATFEEELIGLHIMDEMERSRQQSDPFEDSDGFGEDDISEDDF